MSVCVNCGKEIKGCLCDDCRQLVNIEELCSRIIEYQPGGNALWDGISDGLTKRNSFKHYAFALAGELDSPRKEYYRILSVGSVFYVPKCSRLWLYETYDKIKTELFGEELNRIKGYVLDALLGDYRYSDAEGLASEIEKSDIIPKNTYFILADYYSKTRRYDASACIIAKLETLICEDWEKVRLEGLKDDLQRYKGGREYMPAPRENKEQIRQNYVDFLSSIGIKAELPQNAEPVPEPIPRDEYKMPYEVRDANISKYAAFALTATGESAAQDCVVELAAVRVENGIITDSFSTLVRPYKVGYEKAHSVLRGVDIEDLKNAPQMWTVFKPFMDFVGDNTLVGFNASQDIKYLVRMGRYSHIIINNSYFDIKHFCGEFSLWTLCKKMQVAYKGNSALDIAKTVAEIFIKTTGEPVGKHSFDDLFDDI